MTETTARVESAPVFDLDPAHIGRALMYLTAASYRLGHETPRNTLHYGAADMSTEGGRALAFVRDSFTLTSREIAEKWFGGEVCASLYAAEVWGAALAQHRHAAETPAPPTA